MSYKPLINLEKLCQLFLLQWLGFQGVCGTNLSCIPSKAILILTSKWHEFVHLSQLNKEFCCSFL